MNNYELTLLIDGKATSAKKSSFQQKISKLVNTFKGKVGKTDDWGKKDLAYKIGKSDTGVYLFFELELNSLNAKNFSSKLGMEKEILRYLLVRKETPSQKATAS